MKKYFLIATILLQVSAHAADLPVGSTRNGVAGPEGATGIGYLLYSAENVHTRFTTRENQANHFMAVQWQNEQWVQFNDETPVPFVPRASDILVATLNYFTDTAIVNVGKRDKIHGIYRGVEATDLTVTTNQWAGIHDPGEFTPQGSFITSFTDDPQWWGEGDPPVITPGVTSSNKSPASIGQAKFFVLRALEALERIDLTRAQALRDKLVGPGKIIPSLAAPVDDLEKAANKTILNLGQLKAMVKPFYDQFNEADRDWVQTELHINGLVVPYEHYWPVSGNTSYFEGGYYPWNPDTSVSANKTPANLGQLKALFALRLTTLPFADADGDGLENDFERRFGLDPNNADENSNNIPDAEEDFDLDGLINAREAELGSNPKDSESGVDVSLFSYWPLGEPSGETIYNVIAGGPDGSIAGSKNIVRIDDLILAQHLQFTDRSSYAVVPGGDLEIGKDNADFTVQFWIKPSGINTSSTQHTSIIHKGASSTQRTFAMWFSPASLKIHYTVSTSNDFNNPKNSNGALSSNVWSQVTYVKKGNQSILYLNGEEDSRRVLSHPVISNTGPLHIGDNPWSPGSQAGYRDLKIYKGALFPDEILNSYLKIDADQDGLLDRWEQAVIDRFSTDLINGLDDVTLDQDIDADYITNFQEYRSGSSPYQDSSGSEYDWKPVRWQSFVNTTPVAPRVFYPESGLKKPTSATHAWNAGAVSSEFLPGDGAVTFRFADTKLMMCGLSVASTAADSANYTNINYAIYGRGDISGELRIYEGDYVKTVGPYSKYDQMKIERIGDQIKYYQNDKLIHTSGNPTLEPLVVDSSLASVGAELAAVAVSGFIAPYEDLDGDGMTYEQELQYGFDPNDPTDGSIDSDGDGASNSYEVKSGTDPLDKDSSDIPSPLILTVDSEVFNDYPTELLAFNFEVSQHSVITLPDSADASKLRIQRMSPSIDTPHGVGANTLLPQLSRPVFLPNGGLMNSAAASFHESQRLLVYGFSLSQADAVAQSQYRPGHAIFMSFYIDALPAAGEEMRLIYSQDTDLNDDLNDTEAFDFKMVIDSDGKMFVGPRDLVRESNTIFNPHKWYTVCYTTNTTFNYLLDLYVNGELDLGVDDFSIESFSPWGISEMMVGDQRTSAEGAGGEWRMTNLLAYKRGLTPTEAQSLDGYIVGKLGGAADSDRDGLLDAWEMLRWSTLDNDSSHSASGASIPDSQVGLDGELFEIRILQPVSN